MSLQRSEFIIIKSDYDIKEENELEVESSAGALLTNMWQSDRDEQKCGEIFVSNSGTFNLICICKDSFKNMQTFGAHIRDKHFNVHCPDLKFESVFHDLDSQDFNTSDNIYSSDETKYPRDPFENIQTHSSTTIGNMSLPDRAEFPIEPKWMCLICNHEFKSKSSLTRHKKTHKTPATLENEDDLIANFDPQPEERLHPCPLCNKSFKYRSGFQMHMNSHTGERPYKCPHCTKAFAHSNNRAWHVKRLHLQMKSFICEICDKQFASKGDRKIHMRRHTGEKPYQCESCGKGFILASLLNDHRKVHANVRDVKCPTCDKGFYSKRHLREHMVVHSEVRPHKCPECNATFAARSSFRAHRKLHLEEKKYVCTICERAFAQYAGLYSHKKSHNIKIGS